MRLGKGRNKREVTSFHFSQANWLVLTVAQRIYGLKSNFLCPILI